MQSQTHEKPGRLMILQDYEHSKLSLDTELKSTCLRETAHAWAPLLRWWVLTRAILVYTPMELAVVQRTEAEVTHANNRVYSMVSVSVTRSFFAGSQSSAKSQDLTNAFILDSSDQWTACFKPQNARWQENVATAVDTWVAWRYAFCLCCKTETEIHSMSECSLIIICKEKKLSA